MGDGYLVMGGGFTLEKFPQFANRMRGGCRLVPTLLGGLEEAQLDSLLLLLCVRIWFNQTKRFANSAPQHQRIAELLFLFSTSVSDYIYFNFKLLMRLQKYVLGVI